MVFPSQGGGGWEGQASSTDADLFVLPPSLSPEVPVSGDVYCFSSPVLMFPLPGKVPMGRSEQGQSFWGRGSRALGRHGELAFVRPKDPVPGCRVPRGEKGYLGGPPLQPRVLGFFSGLLRVQSGAR